MSARDGSSGALLGAALALSVAVALVGCDSSDDDDGAGAGDGGDPPTGPGDESAGAGTFAEVIALGATDEPLALDAGALEADLAARFGSVSDDPSDLEDDDTIETSGRRDSRR